MLRPLWPRRWIAVAALYLATSLLLAGTATAQPALSLQPVASGLVNPVGLVNAHDGSNRLFVIEQGGDIKIYDGTHVLVTPFLNIAARVLSGGERGLLGLAFDANYTSNGFFYVYYTSQPAGAVTIARYSVTADVNVADPNSEVILKTQAHSDFANHNGGSLLFGPDGCLYAGIGDGGSGGDPNGNGQNLNTLLAKIIRISPVDGTACTAAPGNPFVGQANVRDEIWALGVRNPWRITFDRQTHDLLIADVGQNIEEEFDVQPAGAAGRNYCWRHKEGLLIFDAGTACTAGTPTDPVLVYDHTAGRCAITGGYRYRGGRIPQINGTYFYADLCTGEIWGATESGGVWTSGSPLFDTALTISTFGEDESGEIYVVDLAGGAFYKLVDTRTATTITLGAAPNPSLIGQSVTFTATVTGSGATGTVAFMEGATTLGTSPLSSGTAVFATSALSVGAHTITAVYSGDATFAGGTSPPLTQTVNQTLSLLVTPATNMFSSGNHGGPFSPPSFQYQLSATTGSINYSISGVPAWLDASLPSGTLTTSPTTVTFTVNSTANSLAFGSYNAIISFSNTTNGQGNQTRNAAVTVNSGGGGGSSPAKTYVSANNSTDAGVCPVTAPCASLNYALSVTDAGGQVIVLDGGVFGPIVITRAVVIDGSMSDATQIFADPTAQVGCIGAPPSGCGLTNNGYAVEIAAGVSDSVKISHVLMGAGPSGGAGALKFTTGGTVQLSENVYRGNDTAAGPIVALYPNNAGTTQAQVYFSHSDIGFNNGNNAGAGAIEVKPGGNTSLKVNFNHVEVHNASYGIRTDSSLLSNPSISVATAISESEFFSFANAAMNAFSTAGTGTAIATFDSVRVLNANVAIKANGPQSTVILTNSTVSGNGIGVQMLNGGHVYTPQNNTITGNGADLSGSLSSAPPR